MSRALPTGRRMAGVGVALGVAVAAALVAPMTASAAPAASFAPADSAAIGPGVQISTPLPNGAELCTANFLYTDADGAVYIGAAAHCNAAEDAMSSVDGCKEPVMPEGTEVSILGRDGESYAGTVAYNSWAVMQAKGESDPALCNLNDFELIKLDDADIAKANPSVPGFGGPTALDTDGTESGEKVYSYQPNQLVATPNKQGQSFGQPEGPRTHVVATNPPGVPGDSGSGYLDAEGKAFGVLSSLMAPTATNGVADIAQALGYAAENGSVGEISLVPGDQPFVPTGLLLTEMPSGPQLPTLPLPNLVPSPLG